MVKMKKFANKFHFNCLSKRDHLYCRTKYGDDFVFTLSHHLIHSSIKAIKEFL